MSITFDELLDKLKREEETLLVEILEIRSEDIVNRFEDYINNDYDWLIAQYDDGNTEDNDGSESEE